MNLISPKEFIKLWSVQIWSLVPILATIDFSTTWIDSFIPPDYKPLVYAFLAVIGLFARTIKQPNLE